MLGEKYGKRVEKSIAGRTFYCVSDQGLERRRLEPHFEQNRRIGFDGLHYFTYIPKKNIASALLPNSQLGKLTVFPPRI